jgi:SAM-dependent methyltransferase
MSTGAPSGWVDFNRRMWDERVPIHVASEFYDVAGFKAGEPQVQPFEVDELGPLGGMRMAHLQCHFGLDTLDLVRMHPELTAVGLDFSGPAVEAASALASEVGLSNRARFVQSDVLNAGATLGRDEFDVVYTGKGALCWLPDLHDWAAECASLLRPGGWLYVCEFHPVGSCLGEEAPVVKYDYFDSQAIAEVTSGSYADMQAATTHNLSYQWPHPLSQVFDAVLAARLELRFFHEWDYSIFDQAKWLEKGRDGRYRWPGEGKLPLMYSLKAQKPAQRT